ncbi:MAG TPA: ATP-binding cassette domain-containing protein [Cyclobacteriaceae bacterium]|nr:ATP-binding cassette domain-containing protein [Cyclobacteriaceae bacterium]
MKQALEFDSLMLSFDGRPILSNVSIKCNTGEIVGLLGRNGSGKSSLMQVVFGSLAGDYKSVRINGKSLHGNYIKEKHIAYLPQDSLIPDYVRVDKALTLFGLREEALLDEFPESRDWLRLYPSQLSGGTQRIVEVLLILKSKAPFCLLDEPFTGVMPVYVQRLKQIILNTRSEKGIIITDHLYRDVISITDRLFVLANGQTYQVNGESELQRRGYINSR